MALSLPLGEGSDFCKKNEQPHSGHNDGEILRGLPLPTTPSISLSALPKRLPTGLHQLNSSTPASTHPFPSIFLIRVGPEI